MGLVTAGAGGKLSFFIGKQILKIITGEPWEKIDKNYTKEEVNYHGNSALQNWINDRIKKEKKETGATYIPAIILDSEDKEVFQSITDYQNNYAKLFGQPSIIPVIYDKYGNEGVEKDFKKFWDEVGKERIKKSGEKDVDAKTEKKKEANESFSFKYIMSYQNFIS